MTGSKPAPYRRPGFWRPAQSWFACAWTTHRTAAPPVAWPGCGHATAGPGSQEPWRGPGCGSLVPGSGPGPKAVIRDDKETVRRGPAGWQTGGGQVLQ